MGANVTLDWRSFSFEAANVSGWVSLKEAVDFQEHDLVLSNRAVYVIRVQRPFAFAYGNGYSPVAYIGKGQFQQRLTSHIKTWISHLAKTVPKLQVQIYYCEPRLPYHGRICEGVEADLIRKFVETYDERPLRNRNTPSNEYEFNYQNDELKVLHPGKGKGYYWALTPLPSSQFHRVR